MDVTPLNKHNLRIELRKRMRCMSGEMRKRESALVFQQLLGWDVFQQATRIGCYLAMPDEVDTQPIIHQFLGPFQVQGKHLAVPVFDAERQRYRFSRLDKTTPLETGAFGVIEPKVLDLIDVSELELLLLPGRGFDRHCNRIGRGKGHIDGLLEEFYGTRAGLAFRSQLVEEIPLEPHDQTLHAIVTPDGIMPRG